MLFECHNPDNSINIKTVTLYIHTTMDEKPRETEKITVAQLRRTLKSLGLKVSGVKAVLQSRLRRHTETVAVANNSQRLARGWLVRRYIARKGPAVYHRELLVNPKDFYTQESVVKISHEQFFSFADSKGQSYGFNLLSFSNLRLGPDTQLRNPYTNVVISDDTYRAARAAIRLGRILGYTINTQIRYPASRSEETIIGLFQEINALGNHTNYRWLADAPTARLRVFCTNLHVIWKYRTGMPYAARCRICPPHGEVLPAFLLSSTTTYTGSEDRQTLLAEIGKACLTFITKAQDIEDRRLAVNLLLCSLTTISRRAAVALPWLYESFAPAPLP